MTLRATVLVLIAVQTQALAGLAQPDATALFPDPGLETHFANGVAEAETFRRGLDAATIAGAIDEFRIAAGLHLRGFDCDSIQVASSIEHENPTLAARLFREFEGEWFGVWDTMRVHHRWGEVVQFDPPKPVGSLSVTISHAQYAWIGDGFGWNLVARPDPASDRSVILGTVYHVAPDDSTEIRLYRPHVGVSCGERRLLWITGGEVFFESVQPATASKPERYSIAGFRYVWEDGEVVRNGKAFRTTYSRDAGDRHPFETFDPE